MPILQTLTIIDDTVLDFTIEEVIVTVTENALTDTYTWTTLSSDPELSLVNDLLTIDTEFGVLNPTGTIELTYRSNEGNLCNNTVAFTPEVAENALIMTTDNVGVFSPSIVGSTFTYIDIKDAVPYTQTQVNNNEWSTDGSDHRVDVYVRTPSLITEIDFNSLSLTNDLAIEGFSGLQVLNLSTNNLSSLTFNGWVNKNSLTINLTDTFTDRDSLETFLVHLDSVSTAGFTRTLTIGTFVYSSSDAIKITVDSLVSKGWTINTLLQAEPWSFQSSNPLSVNLTATFSNTAYYLDAVGDIQSLTTNVSAIVPVISGTVTLLFDNYTDLTGLTISSQGVNGVFDITDFDNLTTLDISDNDITLIEYNTTAVGKALNYDYTESFNTTAAAEDSIDNLILVNGGTVIDDGTNYTGSAGNSVASRIINLGDFRLDGTASPALLIFFEKILALGTPEEVGVGFVISTVKYLCNKTIPVSTSNRVAITAMEEFTEITGFNVANGVTFLPRLYVDSATADSAGGPPDLLASSLPAINSYLSTNPYPVGAYLRLDASDGSTAVNAVDINYKGYIPDDRACGLQIPGVYGGNAKIYDGVADSDEGAGWSEFDRTQPFTFIFSVERIDDGSFQGLWTTNNIVSGSFGRGIIIVFRDTGELQVSINNNSNPGLGAYNELTVKTNNTFGSGKYAGIICYDGLSNDDSFTIIINGVNEGYSLRRPNTLTGTIINGLNVFVIGDIPPLTPLSFFNGEQRKSQLLDTDYSSDSAFIDFVNKYQTAEGYVSDARFLLDVEFDKTSGNLTTRAGTPSYTITASGGAQYERYED